MYNLFLLVSDIKMVILNRKMYVVRYAKYHSDSVLAGEERGSILSDTLNPRFTRMSIGSEFIICFLYH